MKLISPCDVKCAQWHLHDNEHLSTFFPKSNITLISRFLWWPWTRVSDPRSCPPREMTFGPKFTDLHSSPKESHFRKVGFLLWKSVLHWFQIIHYKTLQAVFNAWFRISLEPFLSLCGCFQSVNKRLSIATESCLSFAGHRHKPYYRSQDMKSIRTHCEMYGHFRKSSKSTVIFASRVIIHPWPRCRNI